MTGIGHQSPAIDRAEWRCHEGEAVKAAAEASPRAKRPAARRAMAHSEISPLGVQWWWGGGSAEQLLRCEHSRLE